jgi:hypothetical protein
MPWYMQMCLHRRKVYILAGVGSVVNRCTSGESVLPNLLPQILLFVDVRMIMLETHEWRASVLWYQNTRPHQSSSTMLSGD